MPPRELTPVPSTEPESLAPLSGQSAFVIEEVEILRLTGPAQVSRGVHRQHQVQPAHLYPERRPAAYCHAPAATRETVSLTQHYVRIRTRGGLEGLYGAVDPEVLPVLLGPLRALLLGQDALAIERRWDQMFRSNRHSRAGHYMMAISYLDNALWDLRARHFETPVFRLLGGPSQQPVPVYGSCLGFAIDPELAARKCVELQQAGFRLQKWFCGYGPGDGARGMDLNVQLARSLREAMGEDGQIMFDVYQSWDLQYALEWCRKVDRYRPAWLEEPFPIADLESFRRLSRATAIPLATGEHLYNRWEVQRYLESGALHYVQADPEWCGGLSELVKIGHLCSAHGVKLIPHCHNVHAALHLVASQSPALCPFGEYLINYVPEKLHFIKDAPLTSNGWVTLRERSGFGIELDAQKIERQESLTAG